MVLMSNQHDKIWKEEGYTVSPLQTAVDTEQVRNVQDAETYGIQVSGTKNTYAQMFFVNC